MKVFAGSVVLAFLAALFSGCQSNLKSAPPVTESFIRAGLREQHASGPTLAEGRKVFLTRCIPCHALPEIDRYDPARIPSIVGWMSGRAHLSAGQKEALIKYLLTVRSQ
jgi:mono/diheme cytochrome c family protein